MIEVKNLTKVFNANTRKELCVLKNANLTLPDKGFVCIVGKSGIGKSTILNAIGGLINYSGEILYDGKKVNIEEYRRENIGYIFQDFLLFDDVSIRDNIKIGLNLAGVYDEKEISKRVGLLLKAVHLNVNSSRNAGALSQGQKQRVAIARTLASNPKIILADEPTGNVDSVNSLKIMKILKTLSKDHLIVCVTHNRTIVNQFADLAFVIEDKDFVQRDVKSFEVDEEFIQGDSVTANNLSQLLPGDVVLKEFVNPTDKSIVKMVNRGGQIIYVEENQFNNKTTPQPNQPNYNNNILPEEEINVNFERLHEKQSLRHFLKNLSLISEMKDSNLKKKKKKRNRGFNRIFLPCLLVLFTNIFFYSVRTTQNSVGKQSYNNQVLLTSVKENGTSATLDFTNDDILKIVNDKESGVIEDPTFLPTYRQTQSSALINAKESYILNSAYKSATLTELSFSNYDEIILAIQKDKSNNASTGGLSSLLGNALTSFDGLMPNFNLTSTNSNSSLMKAEYSFSAQFYSLDRVKKLGLFKEFDNIDNLKDDELIFDYNWVKNNLKLSNPNSLVGQTITLYINNSLISYVDKEEFKIKDVIKSPLYAIFANEKIANKYTLNYMQTSSLDDIASFDSSSFDMLNNILGGNIFQQYTDMMQSLFDSFEGIVGYNSSNNINHNIYYDLKSLKDVEIVDYDDIKNDSSYEITLPTFFNPENEKHLNIIDGQKNKFTSFCLISDSYKTDTSLTNLSTATYDGQTNEEKPDPTDDNTQNNQLNLKAQSTNTPSDTDEEDRKKITQELMSIGNFAITLKTGSIKKVNEPNKKVICFLSSLKDVNNITYDSRDQFLLHYIQSRLLFNSSSVIPDNIINQLGNNYNEFDEGAYFLVPSALNNLLHDKLLNDKTSRDTVEKNLNNITGWMKSVIHPYGTYEGSIDDPIYISRVGFNTLRANLNAPKSRGYVFKVGKSFNSLSNSASSYYDYLDAVNKGCPTMFPTTDVRKTVDYLNAYKEHKFDAYQLKEANNAYYFEAAFAQSKTTFIFSLIIVGVIILSSVLDGASKVNKEKYYYGVLRNIGKSKRKIILENSFASIRSLLLQSGISTLIFNLLLLLFKINYLGWYYLLILFIYMFIDFISEIIPVQLLLIKKPNSIIRSLS